MRWLAGLIALGLTMALFHVVTAAGPLEARATLALGFLLLAAVLAGDVAKRVGLPRITGFLLAGVAAGPPGLALVRADEVGALRFLLDAAVALIAFAAGSEVKVQLLQRHTRALVRAGAGALLFPLLAVAVFVLLASPWFPLTVNQPWGDRLTIALALGALAAASSPSVTMALMDELNAHGPYPRLLLTLTIAKDVAVIVSMTLILALGRVLGSSGALDPGALWRMPLVLLGSIALGTALGWLAGAYLRAFTRDTSLFLVGFAVLAAEVSLLLGLEVLLVALAAGCFVTNVTRVEADRLAGALRRGSQPVYAVFFALAGAGLHLEALAAVWPWVLVVAGLRALGLRYGLLWAGRDVSVPPQLAQSGWLGLVSQAGVALGLATVVRRAFPEWGVSLEAFVLAMIGVHEVIGPVLFRRALLRAGEEEVRNGEAREPHGVALLSGGSMQ
jgi:Kef-type K+ transport system membrane component KefB